MFRIRCGRSVTTLPSMTKSPSVGISIPAIIRRRVVFPHPEGPRSTRNSPSFVDRSTWSTARTSPNIFDTERISTRPMVAAAFRVVWNAPGGRHDQSPPGRNRSAFSADQLLLPPLGEDGFRQELGLLDRRLCLHAPGRVGHH